MDVLKDMSNDQINLGSETARETIANLIIATIRSGGKGWYLDCSHTKEREEDDKKLIESHMTDEQKAKASWVCSICGKSTYEVDYDYVGSGTNHLGCELERESEDIDEQAYAQGRESSYDDIPEGLKRAKELSEEAIEEGIRREKNSSQKKHEEKVFPGIDAIQKQIYNEMTSDGLPEGGDTQAVLESHKLADEIVDRQKGKWIYESPDGGKTVFRRPFGDYDMNLKEEINWETKEPTGRKFTDYPFKVNRGPDRRRKENE